MSEWVDRMSGVKQANRYSKEDTVNVVDLIKKAKIEKKKEKSKDIFYAVAAIAFVVVSGLFLAL